MHYYEPREEQTAWGWQYSDDASYHINRDTLNDRSDYTEEKPSGTFRIIALGDSFTFGFNVPTAQNYPEQLEDLLNNAYQCGAAQHYEVLNLGVVGYDVAYSVERFRLRGEKYHPDLVLFQLSADDAGQINETMIQKAQADLQRIRQSMPTLSDKDVSYEAYGNAWQETQKELSENAILALQQNSLTSLTQEYPGPLVLYFLRDWAQWGNTTATTQFQRMLNDFSRQHPNITVFSSTIAQRSPLKENGLLLSDDPHPSAQGHHAIAEELATMLSKQHLIPCP